MHFEKSQLGLILLQLTITLWSKVKFKTKFNNLKIIILFFETSSNYKHLDPLFVIGFKIK